MADPVNFARVTELPAVALIDTVYFVQPTLDVPVRQFVTGNDGVPVEIAAATAADQLYDAGLIAEPTAAAMAAYLKADVSIASVTTLPPGAAPTVTDTGAGLAFALPTSLAGAAQSAGSVDAGKAAALKSDGSLDFSLLSAGKAYANLPQTVLGPGLAPPASDGGNGSTMPLAPQQAYTDASLGQQISQETVIGNNRKPMARTIAKTRGTSPSDFSVGTRLIAGDGIETIGWQGSSGAGQTAHVAGFTVYVDGTPRTGANGEFPGAITFDTGTGRQASLTPEYFGLQNAVTMNFRQQVFFPGETYARQVIAGVNTLFDFGGDFGGVVRVGPGGSGVGMAPFAYDGAHSTLLAVPEPYRIEYDQRYLYNTPGDGTRRRVETKDGRSCTVVALADLGGGTATIEVGLQGYGCGYVTLRTGASPTAPAAGAAKVSYPLAFPTMSNVMLQAANQKAATAAAFVDCAADGFTISLSGALVANTAYRFLFTWTGW